MTDNTISPLPSGRMQARYNHCKALIQIDENRKALGHQISAAEAMTSILQRVEDAKDFLELCNNYAALKEQNARLREALLHIVNDSYTNDYARTVAKNALWRQALTQEEEK